MNQLVLVLVLFSSFVVKAADILVNNSGQPGTYYLHCSGENYFNTFKVSLIPK